MDHELVVHVILDNEESNTVVRVSQELAEGKVIRLRNYLLLECQDFWGDRFQRIVEWRDLTLEAMSANPQYEHLVNKAEELGCPGHLKLAEQFISLEKRLADLTERVSNLECH